MNLSLSCLVTLEKIILFFVCFELSPNFVDKIAPSVNH